MSYRIGPIALFHWFSHRQENQTKIGASNQIFSSKPRFLPCWSCFAAIQAMTCTRQNGRLASALMECPQLEVVLIFQP